MSGIVGLIIYIVCVMVWSLNLIFMPSNKFVRAIGVGFLIMSSMYLFHFLEVVLR